MSRPRRDPPEIAFGQAVDDGHLNSERTRHTRVINFRPAASTERTTASFPVPFVPSLPSPPASLFRLPRQRGTSNGDTLARSHTFVIRLNPICPARRMCVKYAIAHLPALSKRARAHARARDPRRGPARSHLDFNK